MSQDLSKHLWQDRLVLVFSEDHDHQKVKDQLVILRNGMTSLTERKVKVYEISKLGYRYNFSEDWQSITRKPIEHVEFKVQLIGLDGGIKFQSQQVEPLETFEQLIDAMPMRINELKRKSKNRE